MNQHRTGHETSGFGEEPEPTAPTPVLLVIVAVGVALSVVGFLPVAVSRDEVPIVGAVVMTAAVLAVCYGATRAARWLWAYDRWEVRIDSHGVTVRTRTATAQFTWAELVDVAFTNKIPTPGGRPALVIESSRVCETNPGPHREPSGRSARR